MDELLKFSYRTDRRSEHKLILTQNNGQIAFSDENGYVYVTPYRPEISEILTEAGYSESYSLFVPFSNGEERPDEYQWLAKIAEEENWAYTHQQAYEVSIKKGIKPLGTSQKIQIKEILFYDDVDSKTYYTALTSKFLLNQSEENIGTYILVDEKTIVICDEY